MPDQEHETGEGRDGFVGQCVFSGLRGIDIGDEAEVALVDGFSLVKPNEYILSACEPAWMTGMEVKDAASVSRYLVYKHKQLPGQTSTCEEIKNIFNCGMMAIQVLKPIRTLGLIFHGEYTPKGRFSLLTTEHRPPMEPGPWALKRRFDKELLKSVPSAIEGIRRIMEGPSAERMNAVFLLQLGLEHFHPLIAGLLWVMGLEAIFDSANRGEFKEKLCDHLGASTSVFSGWKTVEDIAIPLYVLRNKLAHGVDLREAAFDKSSPVDLVEEHTLPNSSENVTYAALLSEAASYLLCRVLQKQISSSLVHSDRFLLGPESR